MDSASTTVVIGAGQAGLSLVERLRKQGFEGRLILIGEEPSPPYQRPPLSKQFLSGQWPEERLWLRKDDFYAANRIELLLGAPVAAIVPAQKRLRLGDAWIDWDRLALTTGSRPKMLPGVAPHPRIRALRGIGDVAQIAPFFTPDARLVVIGGGYVGLETAAVAVKAGLEVTVLEAAPRILARVACAETAAYFAELHRANGVAIREGATVLGVETGGERPRVRLQDDALDADIVLVGIGAEPCDALARQAGIACENGIAVDARGRTSAPAVWAAGDCASFPWRGERVRLENVQNAIDQAEAVADDMLGLGADYDPTPWFWSDQYDVKLQIAGFARRYETVVARGEGRARSHWYFEEGRLVAVDAIDDPRAFMTAKRLLAAQKPVCPDALRQPDLDLRSLLA